MKIQYASDIHIEFGKISIRRNHLVGDILVLGGDIAASPLMFAEYIQKLHTDMPIIYVLGNHEYYSHVWGEKTIDLYRWGIERAQLNNVFLLENESIVIRGIRFIGATLWTDFLNGAHGPASEKIVRDFAAIRPPKDNQDSLSQDSTRLSWKNVSKTFMDSKRYLEEELSKPFKGPTIVVTHHTPSLQSNPAEHHDSPVVGAFCNNLDEWIKGFGNQSPELWIHGHTHHCVDYQIGKTRVLSNQRGYSPGEIPEFDFSKFVEI